MGPDTMVIESYVPEMTFGPTALADDWKFTETALLATIGIGIGLSINVIFSQKKSSGLNL
jgi:hypothetical protein